MLICKKAIDAKPKGHQAYIVLAGLQASAGNLANSIKTLREGKEQVGPSNFLLGHELTSRLIEAKKLSEAEEALEEMDKASQSMFLKRTAASRREAENRLRILHSQLAIQKGNMQAALVELKAVVATTEQDSSLAMSSSGIKARHMLGALSEKLHYWDLAASSWSSVTLHAPHLGEAHHRAGLAYMKIHQPSKSVFHLGRYLRPTPPDAWTPRKDAWLTLLQSHLRLQLGRSPQSQNWAEFLETLEQAKQRIPGRWEICFAEADYLLAQATSEANEKALQLLIAAEKEFHAEPGFWRNLVRGYSNLKNLDAAERAVEKYFEVEADPIKQGLVRANFLTSSKAI